MSVAQVMQEIDTLTENERLKVQAYLVHLRRKNDPAHRALLSQRLDRMQLGHGYDEADLRQRLKPLASASAE
ncbi:MAG: hypothetical protein RLZZ15_2068 [Verrucomicrobiota bacterium]|jgi:hypothetical protein